LDVRRDATFRCGSVLSADDRPCRRDTTAPNAGAGSWGPRTWWNRSISSSASRSGIVLPVARSVGARHGFASSTECSQPSLWNSEPSALISSGPRPTNGFSALIWLLIPRTGREFYQDPLSGWPFVVAQPDLWRAYLNGAWTSYCRSAYADLMAAHQLPALIDETAQLGDFAGSGVSLRPGRAA
jgi:hypothetical protein